MLLSERGQGRMLWQSALVTQALLFFCRLLLLLSYLCNYYATPKIGKELYGKRSLSSSSLGLILAGRDCRRSSDPQQTFSIMWLRQPDVLIIFQLVHRQHDLLANNHVDQPPPLASRLLLLPSTHAAAASSRLTSSFVTQASPLPFLW